VRESKFAERKKKFTAFNYSQTFWEGDADTSYGARHYPRGPGSRKPEDTISAKAFHYL